MADLEVSGADIETLDDGFYKVTVTEMDARETEFGIYCDFMLEVEGSDYEGLKFGVPLKSEITSASLLGQLINEVSGQEVAGGESYDLEEIFIGEELEVEVMQDSEGFPQVIKTKDDKLAIKQA